MPTSLILLSIIALVLYILFNDLLPPWNTPPAPSYWKSIVTVVVIIVVLLLWYVIPIHVGR